MSGEAFPEHPPKPRLVLRVGVTGKRALANADQKRIRRDLEATISSLADALARCHAAHDKVLAGKTPLLRLVCGMAEGTDQLVAEIAIARRTSESEGKITGVETGLAAILPFAQAEFEEDFRFDPDRPKGQQKRSDEEWGQAVAKFRNLLRSNAIESVLEIDDEVILSKEHPEYRNQAYPNLRDVLLEQIDVLIAISDDVDGGPGGTVDVIRAAVKEGIPVIKISTAEPEVFLLRPPDLDAPDQMPKPDEPLKPSSDQLELPEKLRAYLDGLLAPPKSPGNVAKSHDEAPPARERLEWFFCEQFKKPYSSRIFKAFRNGLTVEAEPHERLCSKAFAAFRTAWKNYDVERPCDLAAKMWPADYDAFTADRGKRIRSVLAERFAWADALAIRYADATRSSYIAIAVLGALAVLVGLLALLASERFLTEAKIAALLIEGVILAIAGFVFFRPAHHARWHQRMVEYRAIAEMLRHQRFLHVLGAADRIARTADRTWREPDAWVGWYVRTTLHELGVAPARLSAQHRRDVLLAFREAELEGPDGQVRYNRGLASRFEIIDRRLNKLIQIAFWITLFAALLGVVALGSLAPFEWFHWRGHERADVILHAIKPYFTVIMAFVPALIAAVHGVRFQMEFRNTAERAAATGRELSELSSRMADALDKDPTPGRKFSVSYIRLANEAMSSDLAGWSNVYRGKAPEPP